MLTIDFINVGYGDAILLRDTDVPFSMLVDCGDKELGGTEENSARIMAADFLQNEGIKCLDLLVLTHLHRDHAGGLLHVLDCVSVREMWTNYLPPTDFWGKHIPLRDDFSPGSYCLMESMNIFLDALGKARDAGTLIRRMDEDNCQVQLTTKLSTTIHLESEELFLRQSEIWSEALLGKADDSRLDELDHFINDTSLRMRISYGKFTMELPGDVYADCWEKHKLSPCTIVKLPHHGHKDSITPHLLEMLKPSHVVISVSGTREDDCPSAYAIELLKLSNCKLHVTDAVRKNCLNTPKQSSVHFEFDIED